MHYMAALLDKGHTTCNSPFKVNTMHAVRSSDNVQRAILTTTLTMAEQAQHDFASSNISHCNQKAGLMACKFSKHWCRHIALAKSLSKQE